MVDGQGEIRVYRKLFDGIEREQEGNVGSSIERGSGSLIICC